MEKLKHLLEEGNQAPHFEAMSYDGNKVTLGGEQDSFKDRAILLSFYRYGSCPLCNLHVFEMMAYEPLMRQNGLQYIGVFESKPEKFPKYIGGKKAAPFPMISDPDRKLYQNFGLEKKMTAIFHPQVLLTFSRAMIAGFTQPIPDGDLRQLPAHFLISKNRTVTQSHYGSHAADFLKSSELIQILTDQTLLS